MGNATRLQEENFDAERSNFMRQCLDRIEMSKLAVRSCHVDTNFGGFTVRAAFEARYASIAGNACQATDDPFVLYTKNGQKGRARAVQAA